MYNTDLINFLQRNIFNQITQMNGWLMISQDTYTKFPTSFSPEHIGGHKEATLDPRDAYDNNTYPFGMDPVSSIHSWSSDHWDYCTH